jgi:hypothetical protein
MNHGVGLATLKPPPCGARLDPARGAMLPEQREIVGLFCVTFRALALSCEGCSDDGSSFGAS